MAAKVNFSGKWKHSKDEGFDELLKALGFGLIKRKAAASLSPQQEITQNGDEFVITNKTRMKTETQKFVVGVEFKINSPATGKEETVKAEWEDGKLVVKNVNRTDGVVVTRELADDTHMTITQVKGEVVCKRYFIKE